LKLYRVSFSETRECVADIYANSIEDAKEIVEGDTHDEEAVFNIAWYTPEVLEVETLDESDIDPNEDIGYFGP
jgi:hypothetical protein